MASDFVQDEVKFETIRVIYDRPLGDRDPSYTEEEVASLRKASSAKALLMAQRIYEKVYKTHVSADKSRTSLFEMELTHHELMMIKVIMTFPHPLTEDLKKKLKDSIETLVGQL